MDVLQMHTAVECSYHSPDFFQVLSEHGKLHTCIKCSIHSDRCHHQIIYPTEEQLQTVFHPNSPAHLYTKHDS